MRHRKSVNHLGRTSAHRKSMLSNMASSLIVHKRITTTVAKAKELRVYVEPIITRSKDNTTHSRRVVFSYLQDKNAVSELFREVAPKVTDRQGGYTRILKIDNRQGDSADMCIIELVDFNANLLGGKEAAKVKSKRRRGIRKKADVIPADQITEASAAADVESVKKTEVNLPEPEKKVSDENQEENNA